MHRTRMITLFYCLSGIAAAFLSWASQLQLGELTYLKGIDAAYSITKTTIGDGWITLLCFCVVVVITITGKRNDIMSLKKILWLMLFAAISLVVSAYHFITLIPLSKPNVADATALKVSPGVGLYLTIIVSVVLIILPLKHRSSLVNKSNGSVA